MTTIGTLLGALEKARRIENVREAWENGEMDFLMETIAELKNCAEVAQNALLSSMPEERLVKLMLIVQKTTAATAMGNGDTALLLCELSGELRGYTQTVILSTIGALIKDEIL